MSDLLELALKAYGGLERWNSFQSIAIELSVAGVLWDLKGQAGLFSDARYEADTHTQRATLGRFGAPDRRVRFTTGGEPHKLSSWKTRPGNQVSSAR